MKKASKRQVVAEGASKDVGTWNAEMHSHFYRTGHYRVSDLRKLIGDPRDSATTSASSEPQVAGFFKNFLLGV